MTIKQLFEHQVATLVRNTLLLDQSHGTDLRALTYVRDLVAHELLHCTDAMNITVAALGALESDSAIECLNRMVNHCHDHHYFNDRVVSAIVVPVSVRIQSRGDETLLINQAEPVELRELASALKETLLARCVRFDRRFYGSTALYTLRTQSLREMLLKLEAGEISPNGGPKSLKLHSAGDAEWRLVHFLGFEVTRLEQERRLNDPPIQSRIKPWLHHAEDAIDGCDEILFNRNLTGEAVCHGVWYLSQGLRRGAQCHRVQRLCAFLQGLEQGVSGVHIYFTWTAASSIIRLLVVSRLMALEFKWHQLGNEVVEDFLRDLGKAASEVIPHDDILEITQLDAQEYASLVRTHGVPSVGGY